MVNQDYTHTAGKMCLKGQYGKTQRQARKEAREGKKYIKGKISSRVEIHQVIEEKKSIRQA
jgi:hypothetical protein